MASEHHTIEAMELQGGLSEKTTTTTETLNMSQTKCDLEAAIPILAPDCVTFIRQKGRYNLTKQHKLRNSLLAGVGFLELANAGDFAANVWNESPLPTFAVVLMGLGGTLALALSYFAFKDAILSRCNLLLLEERRYLRAQKANYAQDPQIIRSLNVQLDVNFRETGMELVDRIGMDITMGFGATLVGVGTFMAIGGANPAVFMASNLLSGYIGSAPVALYGTVNAVWSAYVWRRAHRHQKAGAKELKADIVEGILKRRIRPVKTHANLNGVTGIIGGAASLVTATMWWGYPILVPCIISSIFCNYLWRHRIGYNRPLIRQITKVDKITLVEELQFLKSAKQIIKEAPSDSLLQLVSNPESISSIFKFMVKNDLFEDFCILLLKDTSLSTALFGTSNEELTIMEGIVLHGDLNVFNERLGDVWLFEVK